jgi:hypothetical protein
MAREGAVRRKTDVSDNVSLAREGEVGASGLRLGQNIPGSEQRTAAR